MISENDRNSLINYRLNQATETIDLAKFLILNDKLAIAVNRIYYGIFYALSALALNDAFETSKHAQLLGWFNREYISTKKIDVKYGKILRNSFQNRTKGDYDAFIEFSKSEVDILLFEMIEFIKEIKNLLNR